MGRAPRSVHTIFQYRPSPPLRQGKNTLPWSADRRRASNRNNQGKAGEKAVRAFSRNRNSFLKKQRFVCGVPCWWNAKGMGGAVPRLWRYKVMNIFAPLIRTGRLAPGMAECLYPPLADALWAGDRNQSHASVFPRCGRHGMGLNLPEPFDPRRNIRGNRTTSIPRAR